MTIPVTIVYEDELSEYVITRILNFFGDKFFITQSYPGNGFGYIKSNIKGFNEAARISPFLILTDLDNNACPISLIENWLPFKDQARNLIFRIAVKEVEAWLIADIEGFASYTGVSEANFPRVPELENDPKSTMISIVKRSRNRSLKDDIVPINANARVGPNYNGRLREFVFNHWNIENAISRSNSLKRAGAALRDFEFTF